MLDQAFDALKSYNWGTDIKPLNPIKDAVVAAHEDAAVRKDLETRLAAFLKSDGSRDAKDYCCRKLRVVGSAASVPTLAELLPEKDHSHMARYALERIPSEEAAKAMRDALSKLNGNLKIGAIASLGVRRDQASVAAIAALLADKEAAIAVAAATALGDIGGADAVKALAGAKPTDAGVKQAVIDAKLVCAEHLVKADKKSDAMAIYKSLAGADEPKHVRLAATRGMLACAGKKE
ncbi:MAG TPA: HEAT repeat domain-containing protein [Pirellulales bacterium]|jgi:HEAT repeat protein|nr:HEAT repeat domain-containing protein [Pirellulales bacterium]